MAADTPTGDGAETRPRRRRRMRRLLVGLGVVLVLVAGGAVAYGLTIGRYERNMSRVEGVIDDEATDRPPVPVDVDAQNWLVVGSDSRAKNGTSGSDAKDPLWKQGMQRTDTMMLVHLDGDGRRVSVTSIPRDTWVEVPGHGMNKVNAAFSFGGPKLLVRTVEKLTNVRIDHYAAIDFAGFKAMTDAVGGVDVTVPRTVHDSSQDRTWKKGRHHLDGDDALAYVRQRHGLPNGDLDRIRRQQEFILALLDKARTTEVITNPGRLDGLLDSTSKSVTVDDSVSGGDLRSLVWHYRNIGAGDISFLTLPIATDDMIGGQSVLILDDAEADDLFTALRKDKVEEYLEQGGKENKVRQPS